MDRSQKQFFTTSFRSVTAIYIKLLSS